MDDQAYYYPGAFVDPATGMCYVNGMCLGWRTACRLRCGAAAALGRAGRQHAGSVERRVGRPHGNTSAAAVAYPRGACTKMEWRRVLRDGGLTRTC